MIDALWDMLSRGGEKNSTLLSGARQRLLTFTSLLTFLIAAVWVTLTSGTVIGDRPLLAIACGATPLLFLPFPFLALRGAINLDVLAHAYVALLFAIVTLVAGALGGALSTTSYFLMLVPLLATLLLGVRVGLAWFGAVAITLAGLHGFRGLLAPSTYEAVGSPPLDWVRARDISLWNALMIPLLALAACLSVANFRAVVQRSSAMLLRSELQARGADEARLAAEALARSKSEFITNVSHELRTPLNAIIGYSELLAESAQDQGRQADAADNQRVLDAAHRLLSMVNQILRLSAIEAGRQEVSVDECDLYALVGDAAAAITPAAKAAGNEIVVEPPLEASTCLCDGAKIDHCLRNLLSNAIKFTRDGVITVRVGREFADGVSYARVEVTDTGIGIEASQLDGLFQPFAVADTSVTRQYAGVGLGLAVTRQLARLMGGDVTAESAPGQGSQFTLRVPAAFVAS